MGHTSETTAPLLPESDVDERLTFTEKLAALRDDLRHPSPRNLLIMCTIFGVACGLISLVYSFCLESLMAFTWEYIPEHVVTPLVKKAQKSGSNLPSVDDIGWIYTLFAAVLFASLNGVARRYVGYPGDMENTIERVHSHGFVPLKQGPAMFLCSLFSVNSGSSLGPEAPLLAICATIVSWTSRKVFRQRGRMLRSCTLMGMAAGLSAFFGVSFGGAVFAFEVLHTNGLQHFDTMTYAVTSSVLCLAVYRGLWSLKPFGAIWFFDEVLEEVDTTHIAVGVVLGFVGVILTVMYTCVHLTVKKIWHKVGLVESKRPILTGMAGGFVFGVIGIFLPTTMFWGEFEMKTVADTSVPLEHIWPKGGFWGEESFRQGDYTTLTWFGIGFAKMITIAVTGVSGLRGGFIFPLMLSGACIGRGISSIDGIPWWSDVPASLPAIVLAGALTTGITRTPFACALILTALAGIPEATAPTLIACMIVFYATMSRPFIKAQQSRDDIAFLDVYLPDEDDESMEHDGAAEGEPQIDEEKGKISAIKIHMPVAEEAGSSSSAGGSSSPDMATNHATPEVESVQTSPVRKSNEVSPEMEAIQSLMGESNQASPEMETSESSPDLGASQPSPDMGGYQAPPQVDAHQGDQ
ncbi:hypothetical protein BSKO_07547 [Bryopsis sp. KO-2023]|nr:hypothetical protein BSKO_07547 [Bryopsis sp. KO-2023]